MLIGLDWTTFSLVLNQEMDFTLANSIDTSEERANTLRNLRLYEHKKGHWFWKGKTSRIHYVGDVERKKLWKETFPTSQYGLEAYFMWEGKLKGWFSKTLTITILLHPGKEVNMLSFCHWFLAPTCIVNAFSSDIEWHIQKTGHASFFH